MTNLTAFQTPKRTISTDSKVRYGKEPIIWADVFQNMKSNPQEKLAEKNHNQRHRIQETIKHKNGLYLHYPGTLPTIPAAINQRYVLIGFIVVVLTVICVFEPTLQTNSDEDCWKEFKNKNCSISSPQGSQCVALKDCISSSNVQVSLASVGILSSIGFLLLRFKKFVFKNFKKIMKLVEAVIFESKQQE